MVPVINHLNIILINLSNTSLNNVIESQINEKEYGHAKNYRKIKMVKNLEKVFFYSHLVIMDFFQILALV